MSKSQEVKRCASHISPVRQTRCPAGREQSLAGKGSSTGKSTTDFPPAFHLLPHGILIKNLFYEELRGHSRWIKNPLKDRLPKQSC